LRTTPPLTSLTTSRRCHHSDRATSPTSSQFLKKLAVATCKCEGKKLDRHHPIAPTDTATAPTVATLPTLPLDPRSTLLDPRSDRYNQGNHPIDLTRGDRTAANFGVLLVENLLNSADIKACLAFAADMRKLICPGYFQRQGSFFLPTCSNLKS